MFNNFPLWPILLLALALRMPGWFTQDKKSKFELFEQDEFQYVEMAVSLMQELDSTLFVDWEVEKYIYNVRGFGIQEGWIAFFYHKISGAELDAATLIMIGRGLSTLYALLLIWLVFRIALYLFKDRSVAWLSALFLAIFDLNITYGHYGIPAISYVFWAHLTIFLLLKWYDFVQERGQWQYWPILFAIPFTTAMTFATKFDFIPFFIGGVVLTILVTRKKISIPISLLLIPLFLGLFVLSFGLATAFTLTFEEVRHSFDYLYRQNKDVIESDNHLLYNPFLYIMAIVGGSGLPVVLAGIYGKFVYLKKGVKKLPFGLVIFLIFLALEFVIRWNIDTPFVRRVNIFMPMVAILGAYGLTTFSKKFKKWSWLPIAIVISYTLTIALIGQFNAWNDTRYQARAYLNSVEQADKKVCYSYYVQIPGMPKAHLKKDADLLVLHETYYGRYWKYFTTPFKNPPNCCSEIYHCLGEEECAFYQNLLAGNDPDFELHKTIPTIELMPERVLYKHLFGSYETFLGDVLIFKRKRN